MKIDDNVKISVVVGNSIYKYKGKILEINDCFLTIFDRIEGKISISRDKIATIVEVEDD